MTLKELFAEQNVIYGIKRYEETKNGVSFNIKKKNDDIKPFEETWVSYNVKDLQTRQLIFHIGMTTTGEHSEFFIDRGHKVLEDSVFLDIYNEVADLYNEQEEKKKQAYDQIKDVIAKNRAAFVQSQQNIRGQ